MICIYDKKTTKGNFDKNKGNLPQYYAEGTHPAIIDIDIFKRAREIMSKKREKHPGKKERERYVY